MIHVNQTIVRLYAVLTSKEFLQCCHTLKQYGYFLEEEIRPFEKEDGVIPLHPERRKKYMKEKEKAQENLIRMQNLFLQYDLNFVSVEEGMKVVPFESRACNQLKTLCLIKNLFGMKNYNFDKTTLKESICIFVSFKDYSKLIIENLKECFLCIINDHARKIIT
jgi:hypothetical protein